MSSKRSAKDREAVVQLAQLLMDQRGERWSQRKQHSYTEALKQRMGEIRTREQQELTGAELFCTIARLVPLSWEDAPEEERALYNEVVRNFTNEREVEKQEQQRADSAESVP